MDITTTLRLAAACEWAGELDVYRADAPDGPVYILGSALVGPYGYIIPEDWMPGSVRTAVQAALRAGESEGRVLLSGGPGKPLERFQWRFLSASLLAELDNVANLVG